MKAEELAVYSREDRNVPVRIGRVRSGEDVPQMFARMVVLPTDLEMATRLVKCWNCHDELIAALTDLMQHSVAPEDPESVIACYDMAFRDAEAILAKAK